MHVRVCSVKLAQVMDEGVAPAIAKFRASKSPIKIGPKD
jgi:hypothetical protein